MEIEQLEIRDFLARCPPLDKLESAALERLVDSLEISYVRKGTTVLKIGGQNLNLYLIRMGAVEVIDPQGRLVGRHPEGEWFGYRSALSGGEITLSVIAYEDSLLYALPADVMESLMNEDSGVKNFFDAKKNERLKGATTDMRGSDNAALISTRVSGLIHRTPLLVEAGTAIQDAAQKMKDAVSTAMLVMDGDRLLGIVTDRAFCTKVVAAGRDIRGEIRDIMTPAPLTVRSDAMAAEALLMMARHNVRHLPVTDGEKIIGMVTATDLIRHQSHNAIYLINEIHRARDIQALVSLSQQLPDVLVALVQSSMMANDIGHAISSVGEAITRRLLDMATRKLGPAPVDYVWIAAGSLARREQTARSDQDNAIILSDDYNPEQHGQYFEDLARFVCDGLNDCGYVYCPGDVMAMNTKWRQPMSVWRTYFREWIDTPRPKALMYSSIFFDLRAISGNAALLESLQSEVLRKTQDNSIFLAHMAANALAFAPPLGFFRSFVLEKGGEQERALNMKKRGVMPIIDLARVYALSVGSSALNTFDRLQAAQQRGALSQTGMQDLRDAYELITTVRLQHQALQIQAGNRAPDNYVPPDQLSSLERRHLKDAFEVVSNLQSALETRYQTGRLG